MGEKHPGHVPEVGQNMMGESVGRVLPVHESKGTIFVGRGNRRITCDAATIRARNGQPGVNDGWTDGRTDGRTDG